jgi:hypothetical protein
MPRSSLVILTAVVVLAGSLIAADMNAKAKDAPKPVAATIVKVDAQKGEITVKFTDPKGKETEQTFHLAGDVRLLDETGRVRKE